MFSQLFNSSLTVLLVGVFASIALWFSTIKRIPEWIDEIGLKIWKTTNFIAMLTSVVWSAVLATFFSHPNAFSVASSISAACLNFVFVQSLITDFKVRFVDRKTMRLAILLSFLYNACLLLALRETGILALSAGICAVLAILLLVPSVGASDVRALVLVTVAGLPVFGLVNYVHIFQAVAAVVLVYSLFAAAVNLLVGKRKKEFSSRENLSADEILDSSGAPALNVRDSLFRRKLSVPAVPLVLAPFVFASPFFLFFN